MASIIKSFKKKLGEGAFGSVYMAEDQIHGDVAVKVLAKRKKESLKEWERRKNGLLREGKLLAQATHDNVVRVYRLEEDPSTDTIHLVQELCNNGSLECIYENGPSSLIDVRNIITQVVLGLREVHSKGLVHRDIKPGNILVDDRNTVKLADFGLVSEVNVLGYASAQGYVDHLAIEVLNGSGTSKKTDVWALGMTIYRLLHGQLWYSSFPRPKYQIQTGNYANKLKWLPHIPTKWRALVRKMMHDDPSCRYADAGALLSPIANLQITPNWKCIVDKRKITWSTYKKDRIILVEQKLLSQRKQEWVALSKPLVPGPRKKDRILGESNGVINSSKAMSELTKFFKGFS
jgi:eukaryotic-like serine/threonine-protein kinase